MATDDEDFAAMFAESEKDKPRAKRPKIGDLVKGKIITVGKEAVFVDLGGKAEGHGHGVATSLCSTGGHRRRVGPIAVLRVGNPRRGRDLSARTHGAASRASL
jgi:hypothetical protein